MGGYADMFDLSGKVACVTGASSGLGQVMANVLIAQGARVVGVARRRDALESWSASHQDRANFVVSDLANITDYEQVATDRHRCHGPQQQPTRSSPRAGTARLRV